MPLVVVVAIRFSWYTTHQFTKSDMRTPNTDRHKEHSKQYNVRVPVLLLRAFLDACRRRKLQPTAVLRTLIQGFVDVSADADEAAREAS